MMLDDMTPPTPPPSLESDEEDAQNLEEFPQPDPVTNRGLQRSSNRRHMRHPSPDARDEGQGAWGTNRRVLGTSPIPAIDDFRFPPEYYHSSTNLDKITPPPEFYEIEEVERDDGCSCGPQRRWGSSRSVLPFSPIPNIDDFRFPPEYYHSSSNLDKITPPPEFYEIEEVERDDEYSYGPQRRWGRSRSVQPYSPVFAIDYLRFPPERYHSSNYLDKIMQPPEFYDTDDIDRDEGRSFGRYRRWGRSRSVLPSSPFPDIDYFRFLPESYHSPNYLDKITPPPEFYEIEDTDRYGGRSFGRYGRWGSSRSVLPPSPVLAIDYFHFPPERYHSSKYLDKITPPPEFYETDDIDRYGRPSFGRYGRWGRSRSLLPSPVLAIDYFHFPPERYHSSKYLDKITPPPEFHEVYGIDREGNALPSSPVLPIDHFHLSPEHHHSSNHLDNIKPPPEFYEVDGIDREGGSSFGRHRQRGSSRSVLPSSPVPAIDYFRFPPERYHSSNHLDNITPPPEFHEVDNIDTDGGRSFGRHRRWVSSRSVLPSSPVLPIDYFRFPPERFHSSNYLDKITPPPGFHEVDDINRDGGRSFGRYRRWVSSRSVLPCSPVLAIDYFRFPRERSHSSNYLNIIRPPPEFEDDYDPKQDSHVSSQRDLIHRQVSVLRLHRTQQCVLNANVLLLQINPSVLIIRISPFVLFNSAKPTVLLYEYTERLV
jgi:hypothetical protein